MMCWTWNVVDFEVRAVVKIGNEVAVDNVLVNSKVWKLSH